MRMVGNHLFYFIDTNLLSATSPLSRAEGATHDLNHGLYGWITSVGTEENLPFATVRESIENVNSVTRRHAHVASHCDSSTNYSNPALQSQLKSQGT